MIFSSLPVYLDAPYNWQQQLLQERFSTENPDHHLLLPPLYPKDHRHGTGGAAGSFRPGNMADRARQAKIPLPEAGLKCPRCESTNTKFCYFNNYSLSQPRHFCKTCRRYWTRGGALRNVPVGGGCRRNKNSNKSCSNPPAFNDGQTITNANGSENTASGSCTSELICPFPQENCMASTQKINSPYGIGNMGLNSGSEIQAHSDPLSFHMRNTSSGGITSKALCGSTGVADQQWSLKQFPLLTSTFDSTRSAASCPFQSGCAEEPSAFALTGDSPLGIYSSCSNITRVITDHQLSPVKYEDNQRLNFQRSSSQGFSENNFQYWGRGNSTSWTEISPN